MKKKQKIATSLLGLTFSALLLTGLSSKVEAAGLTPEWLDTPTNQRIGVPPAFSAQSVLDFADYEYYTGKKSGGKLYLFRDTNGTSTYYTPIARGQNTKYQSNIIVEEQLKGNSKDLKYGVVNHPEFLINKNYSNLKSKAHRPPSLATSMADHFKYVVDSNNLIKEGTYAGYKGEWRVLGYSEVGDKMSNSAFPVDILTAGTTLANYKFGYYPWTRGHNIVGAGTKYDTFPKGTPNYNTKLAAITTLYDTVTDLQRNSKVRAGTRAASIANLKNIYSLRNNPAAKLDTVYEALNTAGFYTATTIPTPTNNRRNLAITSIEIKDASGKQVGRFTRNLTTGATSYSAKRDLVVGEKVTAYYNVKNTTNYTISSSNVEILTGLSKEATAKSGLEYIDELSSRDVKTASVGRKLKGGETTTIEREFVIPNQKVLSVEGVIGTKHRYSEDNIRTDDDYGEVLFNVNQEQGNFNLYTYMLIDANGKEVSYPQPGEKYKIRFKAQYKGDNASRKINVRLTYNIFDRALPWGSTDGTAGFIDEAIQPKNGAYYSFTTPDYVTYELGMFGARATFSGGFSDLDKGYNTNTSDDAYEYIYSKNYDIALSNVKVVPYQTYDASAEEMTFLVKYDANYTTPDYVKNHDIEVTFKTSIGGQEKIEFQHLKKGLNKNLSTIVKVPMKAGNKEVKAVVEANYGKYYVETNYKNNSGSASATVQDPSKVSVPSTAKNTFSWRQFINRRSWSIQKVTYDRFNGTQHTFEKFQSAGESNDYYNLNESYQIENVWFRSKVTKDLKKGANKDGWIDLLKEKGQVKAGYGYELYVTVGYKTNAFTTVPKEVLKPNSLTPGVLSVVSQWVRPQLAGANIPSNIFVQTPDNKIHSVTGRSGTTSSMKLVNRSGNETSLKLDFEVKPTKVLGTDTTGKFYVDENVSNGTYNLSVFTPQVPGVSGKMSGQSTDLTNYLQDAKKNLKIEVIGSAYDDVNDHITQ